MNGLCLLQNGFSARLPSSPPARIKKESTLRQRPYKSIPGITFYYLYFSFIICALALLSSPTSAIISSSVVS